MVGEATGLAMLELLSPVVGDHENPVPPEALSVVLSPEHIALSEPAFAIKIVAKVTIAESIAVQPLALATVTVYVVVDTGEA